MTSITIRVVGKFGKSLKTGFVRVEFIPSSTNYLNLQEKFLEKLLERAKLQGLDMTLDELTGRAMFQIEVDRILELQGCEITERLFVNVVQNAINTALFELRFEEPFVWSKILEIDRTVKCKEIGEFIVQLATFGQLSVKEVVGKTKKSLLFTLDIDPSVPSSIVKQILSNSVALTIREKGRYQFSLPFVIFGVKAYLHVVADILIEEITEMLNAVNVNIFELGSLAIDMPFSSLIEVPELLIENDPEADDSWASNPNAI